MYVILLAFLKGGCRSLPYRDLPLRHIHCWWWTERCTSTQADIVWCCVHEFLSTLSAWRATKVCWYRYLRQRHFYPRSPHGERLGLYSFDFTLLIDFYPRSPHGERPHHNYIIFIAYVFLSTLSAWRATGALPFLRPSYPYFYPRSPHGERHSRRRWCRICYTNFYPRSPHGERHMLVL